MEYFQTQFILSQDYLGECFDQSLPHGKNAKPNYLFPALLLTGGSGLLFFTEQPMILGSMAVALAVLELFHIRFRRAWWITRQTWGKSPDNEVTLSIDDDGLQTESLYAQSTLMWTDVQRLIETELGLILVAKHGGQQYLSKSLFSAERISEIMAKVQD